MWRATRDPVLPERTRTPPHTSTDISPSRGLRLGLDLHLGHNGIQDQHLHGKKGRQPQKLHQHLHGKKGRHLQKLQQELLTWNFHLDLHLHLRGIHCRQVQRNMQSELELARLHSRVRYPGHPSLLLLDWAWLDPAIRWVWLSWVWPNRRFWLCTWPNRRFWPNRRLWVWPNRRFVVHQGICPH